MRYYTIIFIVAFAVSLTGCGPFVADPAASGGAAYFPCAKGNADAYYTVPVNFDSRELYSGSGGYYYREGCSRFTTDITLTNLSNCGPYDPKDGYLGPCRVKIGADAHDLPSSDGYGGTEPTIQEDCNRYLLRASFFSKHKGDPYFKYIKSATRTYPGCAKNGSSWIIAESPSPDEPWKVYRVTVDLLLRSSAQEVKVVVEQPPLK